MFGMELTPEEIARLDQEARESAAAEVQRSLDALESARGVAQIAGDTKTDETLARRAEALRAKRDQLLRGDRHA